MQKLFQYYIHTNAAIFTTEMYRVSMSKLVFENKGFGKTKLK